METVGKQGKVYSTQSLLQAQHQPPPTSSPKVSAGQTSFLIADDERLLLNQQQKSGAASVLDTGEVLFLQKPNIPLPRGTGGGGGGLSTPPPPSPPVLGKSIKYIPQFIKTEPGKGGGGSGGVPPPGQQQQQQPVNSDPSGKLVPPTYGGGDVTFSKYDQKTGDMVDVDAKGVDIQRALKEVFDEINDSDVFRSDNVLKFLASVAASSGRRDVKTLYKSPEEILEDFPGGMEYLHTKTQMMVKQTIATNRRTNVAEISYSVPRIDRFNQIVHSALSPSKLGRIFIKPVVMAFINDAFTHVRAFNASFRAIPNVGILMNTDNNDVRNYFAKLVGLSMRLEDARSGSSRTFEITEDRIMRDIGLLVNGRMSYFIYRGGGKDEFYDSISDDQSLTNPNVPYKRQRLSAGPSYSFSDTLQIQMK